MEDRSRKRSHKLNNRSWKNQNVSIFPDSVLRRKGAQGTLRSRTGDRTTARQRTVRTGPKSPSHAMDKYLEIVVDGDAILLPEYFGHCGLTYGMLNISYRGLGSVFSYILGIGIFKT